MMDFQLQPLSEAGRRLVDMAEKHAEDFATRADEHDQAGTFAFENYRALQESGFMGAAIPTELGGLGVNSIHDIAVAFNRLGRGDAATSIGAVMHVMAGWTMLSWKSLRPPDDPFTGMLDLFMGQMVSEQVVCAALSEPGTYVSYPLTELTPTDGGWLINGRKIFCTNSSAATVVMATVRFGANSGSDEFGFAWVPVGTPGMEVLDNWDAMGMRGSGSNDIVFRDCFIPEMMAMPMSPWGEPDGTFLRLSVPGFPQLVAVFLGIAEAAHDHVVGMLRSRRKAPNNRTMAERPPVQAMVAENEVDLAAARAILARSARTIDEALGNPTGFDLGDMHELHKDIQCMKTFVQRKAIDVVDRAMTLSGGAGYVTGSPLSRHYRDVRAGPFMQPYSPNEAHEYIGKVALGLDPKLDL